MYKEHPRFLQPENDDVKVWRYMDFTKFIALLNSSCLFFSRVDRFDDPFEGSWPTINVLERERVPQNLPFDQHEMYLQGTRRSPDRSQAVLKLTAVNCWHENEHESAAMWKIYVKGTSKNSEG